MREVESLYRHKCISANLRHSECCARVPNDARAANSRVSDGSAATMAQTQKIVLVTRVRGRTRAQEPMRANEKCALALALSI